MDLNFTSPINKLSYGYSGFNILKQLILAGHKPSLFPMPPEEVDYKDDVAFLKQGKEYAQYYNPSAPSVRLYHQFNLAQHVGKGLHVGFPIFELTRFSKVERHHLESQDRILVCSEWAKEIVLGATRQKDVRVVPLGVNSYTDSFSPAYQRSPGTECVFINVGKWEKRKGHLSLTCAFDAAFDVNDKVELWLMPTNIFCTKDEKDSWEEGYLNSRMGKAGKVKLVPRLNTHKETIDVMRAADVGVWPSLAEGWNLPLLEMMSLGKQVIATNYSAHTEFCNSYNCNLIPIHELELAHDGKWFFGQGEWAKWTDKSQECLIEYMRQIYQNQLYLKSNDDGILTGRKYSWKNTAERLTQCLI